MTGSSVDVSPLRKISCFEDAVEVVCQTLLERLGRLLATTVESLSATKSLDIWDGLTGGCRAVQLDHRLLAGKYHAVSVTGASSIYKLAQVVAK
jgi:hypothetical protein